MRVWIETGVYGNMEGNVEVTLYVRVWIET